MGSRRHEAADVPRLAQLEPMLLDEVDRPFDREGWGFELKYDGWVPDRGQKRACRHPVAASIVRSMSDGIEPLLSLCRATE